MSDQQRKPRRDWGPMLFSFGGLLGLAELWALDTFTVQGFLAAAWPWADTTGLLWAWGTRIVWWVIFGLAGVATIARLMWHEAVLSMSSHLQLWASAPVSAAVRIKRRALWWADGIDSALKQHRAHRPVSGTVQAVSGDVRDTVRATPAAAAA